jgi:hypothetical protein
MKLNGTQKLLIYADDKNLLGDNIHTIKKNMETLIDASKICIYIKILALFITNLLNI